MHTGRTVFAQLFDFLPMHTFRRCVERYRGDHKIQRFTCRDQFLAMAFAQLTSRESLRDIEACLRAQRSKLYHMGIDATVARNTLANANKVRDWRIYADFAQALILTGRELYRNDDFGLELTNTIYALDSTTINLCLSLFPWALSTHTGRGAMKMHTLLDLRGNIPTFIEISHGRYHDMRILDVLVPEPGAIYVMDRAYTDFARLHRLHQHGAFSLLRAKQPLRYTRISSRAVDKGTGLLCDQTITFSGFTSVARYPERLRRIRFFDAVTDKHFVFLTNNFTLPALTIADAYRYRWHVELFFKWIKQHLRI
jgi:hypothetical protein